MCNSRLHVREMVMRGVVCEHVCVCLSGRVYICMRECVRVEGLAPEETGCWPVSRSCHLVKRAKVKVCNELSLWLMTAHNSCGLSLTVVSSARWNIKTTSSATSSLSSG